MKVHFQSQMTQKYSEWRKNKKKENDNKRPKTNNLKSGKKESKKQVSQSGNSMTYKKPPNKKSKMQPKSVSSKLQKLPLKTE